ncbi:MAG: amino acid permease, partial [Nitrosopumilaceae archaeon]
MSTEKPSSGLVRSLSLLDITMVGVAAMIGGAIFVLVGPAMDEAGPALMIAFLINGIITMFTALTYAELGSALPEAGGGYKWIREGLPRPNAFISGWMSWFGHMIAGSLYAVAFGSFFGHLLTLVGVPSEYVGVPLEKIIAVLVIVLFTYINVKGVSDTGKIGNAITFSQLVIIFVLIVAGLYAMTFTNPSWSTNFENFFPNGSIGLIIAMGLTFIAFEGYEIIVQTGEEVKNPKKNIPRAIFISLGVVVTLYIIFAFVFI